MPAKRQSIIWNNDGEFTDAYMRNSATMSSTMTYLSAMPPASNVPNRDPAMVTVETISMRNSRSHTRSNWKKMIQRSDYVLTVNLTWSWWRHQMEMFSALLAFCAGKSQITGEFPSQRPVTQSFDVFFDLRANKRLSKQSRRWRFETFEKWKSITIEGSPTRLQ